MQVPHNQMSEVALHSEQRQDAQDVEEAGIDTLS